MTDGSGPGLALLILFVLVILVGITGFVVVRRRSGTPSARTLDAPPVETLDTAPEATPILEAPPVLDEPAAEAAPVEAPPVEAPPLEAPPVERGRVRSLRDRIGGLLRKPALSDADLDELEEVLLRADVGANAAIEVVSSLRKQRDGEPLELLRGELRRALGDPDRTLAAKAEGLTVWLVTGVNGSGKTTTIGKLAAQATTQGRQVVLAAADTFRAAADEQLETWASRAGAHVVKHQHGADPAAVVFDGVKAATARGADLLVVDTAGRLQSKTNLMEELSKIRRVLDREAGPPDEVLLVIDATTGQNGLSQARAFADAAGVTGIALTKLDGSAKGGIVIAVQQELGIPVKLVGLGEGIEDLAPFDPDAFLDDLLN